MIQWRCNSKTIKLLILSSILDSYVDQKNKILSIFPKQQQTLLFLVSYCHSECRYSSYLENWIMQIWYVKWNKSSSYECIFNISIEKLVGMGCHVSLWWIIYQKFQMFNVKKLSMHNVPWTNVMLNFFRDICYWKRDFNGILIKCMEFDIFHLCIRKDINILFWSTYYTFYRAQSAYYKRNYL